jgi:hypothetical protein
MKTWTCRGILSIAFVLLALSGTAWAQANDIDGCSKATLKGDYATRISGQVFTAGGAVLTQRDGIAMQHFDGAGGLTQVDFVQANGVLVPGPPDATTGFHINETGTYEVFPDCTGTATINFPSPGLGLSGAVIEVMFVLSNHGRTIHQIVSSLTPPGPTGKQVSVPANIHADSERLGSVGENDHRDSKMQ